MTIASGQCLCGAVTFTAENVDREFYACHCDMCLRLCGGPYMAVAATGVNFEGSDNLSVFESSAWAERGFCRVCGSNVFYHVKKLDEYDINIGTFDDASTFRMIGEIFIDEKPDCYEFAGDRPRLTSTEAIEKFSFGQD